MKAEEIIDIVARQFELNVEDVMHKRSRKADLIMCRHLIFYFLRKYCSGNKGYNPMEYKKIGKMFNMDHASIIHGEKKIKGYLTYNVSLREQVEHIQVMFECERLEDLCTFCGQYKKLKAI